MTYSMGALAVQTIAYYFFKMFFEQQMQDRVQMAEMQNQRSRTMRQQQMSFDQRRAELEMRMQVDGREPRQGLAVIQQWRLFRSSDRLPQ
jgi:hypothetical protein